MLSMPLLEAFYELLCQQRRMILEESPAVLTSLRGCTQSDGFIVNKPVIRAISLK